MLNNHGQMCTIMLSMLPERTREYAMQRYDEGETKLEEFGDVANVYLMKHGSQQAMQKGVKKNIRMVAGKGEEEEKNKVEDGNQWQECYDESYGTYWICTASPAMKRQRTDDEQGQVQEEQPIGFGKAKGKGKGNGGKGTKGKDKGPKSGCHECGGDHYARPREGFG